MGILEMRGTAMVLSTVGFAIFVLVLLSDKPYGRGYSKVSMAILQGILSLNFASYLAYLMATVLLIVTTLGKVKIDMLYRRRSDIIVTVLLMAAGFFSMISLIVIEMSIGTRTFYIQKKAMGADFLLRYQLAIANPVLGKIAANSTLTHADYVRIAMQGFTDTKTPYVSPHAALLVMLSFLLAYLSAACMVFTILKGSRPTVMYSQKGRNFFRNFAKSYDDLSVRNEPLPPPPPPPPPPPEPVAPPVSEPIQPVQPVKSVLPVLPLLPVPLIEDRRSKTDEILENSFAEGKIFHQ